jgi:hypothetical protein
MADHNGVALQARMAPAAAVEELHAELRFKPLTATLRETHVFALAACHRARGLLLEDKVAVAEALLRDGLTNMAPLARADRACLLNDLGLCALHDGRHADAVQSLRHALDVLPASPPLPLPADAWESPPSRSSGRRQHRSEPRLTAGTSTASTVSTSLAASGGSVQPWVVRMRAQLHINLCEALLLHREPETARLSAREAVRLAQLGMAAWDDEMPSEVISAVVGSEDAAAAAALAAAAATAAQAYRYRGASTPRLLSARWLLPAAAVSPSAAAASAAAAAAAPPHAVLGAPPPQPSVNSQPAAAGCLSFSQLAVLGFLWRAVSAL